MPGAKAAPAGYLLQWRRRARRRCWRAGIIALVAFAVAAAGKSSVAAFISGSTSAAPRRRLYQVRRGASTAQPGLSIEADTTVAEEVNETGLRAHLLGLEGASAELAEEGGADKAIAGTTNITLVRSTDAIPVSLRVEEPAPLYEKAQRIGQRLKALVEDIFEENGTAQLHIGERRPAEIDIAELDDDDWLEPLQFREVYVKDFDQYGNAVISMKPVQADWRIRSDFLRPGARRPGRVKGFNVFGDVFVDIGADRHAWLPATRRYRDDNLTVGKGLKKVYVRKQTEDGILLDVLWPKDVFRPVADLRVGERLMGVVAEYSNRTGTAYVDVGAVRRGMLLRKHRVNRKSNALQMGATVVVYVKDKLPDDSGFALTEFPPKLALESLVPGERHEGSFDKLLHGGAFIDIGAVRSGWLPPGELEGPLGDHVGPGKNVTVWVAEVREEKDFLLTLEEPKFGYRGVPLGSNLTGVVVAATDSGTFVDVGWVSDAFVGPQQIPAGLQPRVGDKVETWVSAWRDGQNLQLTMIKPRVVPMDLVPMDQIKGRVVDVQHDGTAFVDFGSTADALLPEDRLGGEVVEVGDEVDARVYEVKRDGRVVLSLEGVRDTSREMRQALPE